MALTIPAGKIGNLPVGLQIMGPHFSEPELFKVAYAFEKFAS